MHELLIMTLGQGSLVELIVSESTEFNLCIYVVVNFLSQVIFVFLLFLRMVKYANEVVTKEK